MRKLHLDNTELSTSEMLKGGMESVEDLYANKCVTKELYTYLK